MPAAAATPTLRLIATPRRLITPAFICFAAIYETPLLYAIYHFLHY